MQHQLWNLAQRTSALPFGRGAFTLATTHTLLTEVYSVYIAIELFFASGMLRFLFTFLLKLTGSGGS